MASIRSVKFYIKMRWNTMFITAVCVIFLIMIMKDMKMIMTYMFIAL